jgi:4-amino-4-deoxy-L-arabinose transferase-like glycosyltransferase
MRTFSEEHSSRIDAALEWLSSSHRRAAALLFVVALICLLPGFASLPVTNRDGARYAHATKQMMASGDWVDIRFQDAPRYQRPVGIHWIQAAFVEFAEAIGIPDARNHIAVYRAPSLVAAFASIFLTYWAALAFVARRYALLAALGMATSLLLGVEARLASTDAALLVTGVAVFGLLGRVYIRRDVPMREAEEWKTAILFWLAIGISILLKGPILSLIAGLTVLMLAVADRNGYWIWRLKPVPGMLWLVLVVIPWFAAVYWRADGDLTGQPVVRELVERFLDPAEGIFAPPGYFWLLFWFTFWPMAMLAPMATRFGWSHRFESGVRFLIAWIVPGWLVFEFAITKLPHYVLPLYPAIAILIALALERRAVLDNWTRGTGILWPVFSIGTMLLMVFLAYSLDGKFGKAFWPAALIAIGFSAYAWWRLLFRNPEHGLVLAMIAAAFNTLALYTVLPRVQGLAIGPRLIAAAQAAPCRNPKLASAGYTQPNILFLGGEDTVIVRGDAAAEFLRLGGCRVAFVESREERAFADRSAAIGLNTVRIGTISGFDYTRMRRVNFQILAAREG